MQLEKVHASVRFLKNLEDARVQGHPDVVEEFTAVWAERRAADKESVTYLWGGNKGFGAEGPLWQEVARRWGFLGAEEEGRCGACDGEEGEDDPRWEEWEEEWERKRGR